MEFGKIIVIFEINTLEFKMQFWKTVVIFKINTLEFVKKYKVSRKNIVNFELKMPHLHIFRLEF